MVRTEDGDNWVNLIDFGYPDPHTESLPCQKACQNPKEYRRYYIATVLAQGEPKLDTVKCIDVSALTRDPGFHELVREM